jgi:hypothetical protein
MWLTELSQSEGWVSYPHNELNNAPDDSQTGDRCVI